MLAQFAQQVRQLVGEEGMVARIGGEEFAVAALTSSGQEARLLAEKIRQGIEAQTFTWGQSKIQLTISMGLESQPLGAARITDLFNQLLMAADDYMIQAKNAGRNRIFTQKMA
jgi:diguanylate cyclase (GGDEF)-like protein